MTPQEAQHLAAHESLELHELLNFKTLCLAKSKLMQGLVFDQALKGLMVLDVQHGIQSIRELQSLYKQTPFAGEVPENRPTPMTEGGRDA